MKRTLRKLSRGFTLIELMIVVAIVGILAVLAIYGVRKYLANAKTAEARNSLGQMGKDQAAEYEKESMSGTTVLNPGAVAGLSRSLCIAPTSAVPATTASIKGQKYQSSQAQGADWNLDQATAGKGFACLGFTMDEPQYYQYNFTTPGSLTAPAALNWTGAAVGDLNGDGVTSLFQLNGRIEASYTFALAPNLVETNPEE